MTYEEHKRAVFTAAMRHFYANNISCTAKFEEYDNCENDVYMAASDQLNEAVRNLIEFEYENKLPSSVGFKPWEIIGLSESRFDSTYGYLKNLSKNNNGWELNWESLK